MGLKTDNSWTCNLDCLVREIIFWHAQKNCDKECVCILFQNTHEYIRQTLQIYINNAEA